MKILIYGRDQIRKKVTSILTRNGIKTNDISTTANLAVALNDCEKPDIALIDWEAINAVTANECIQKRWDIPIVLMMGRGKGAWQGLEQFVADGYMDSTLKNEEFMARLSAIQRRITANNEVNSR